MMNGILVIGHGSRSEDAYHIFYKIVDSLRKRVDCELEGCFMELSSPQIPEMVEKMIHKGVKHITVLPYFLFNGIHIKEDIPEILQEIKEKYDDIIIKMAEPIGYHQLLVDILIDRIGGEKQCI